MNPALAPHATSVRVSSLACYAVKLPLTTHAYTMSHGRRLTELETTVVEVRTDDGPTGYGEVCTLGDNYIEAFPGSVQATVKRLARWVFESSVMSSDVLDRAMDRALRGHRAGKAAIDAAMWDLRGKLLGLPVVSLLGGAHQEACPVFHPLTMAPPDEMAAEATRMRAEGYRHWQLKVGGEPAADATRVHAVLEAVAGQNDFLTSDANGGWSAAEARTFLASLGGAFTYVEQPCQSLRELAGLRSATALPLIADEIICDLQDLAQCVEQRAADAINLKPTRVGGFTKAARLRDLAQAMGLMVMIDEPMGGDIASTSLSHLAASCRPEFLLSCSYLASFSSRRLLASGGARLEHGTVRVPTAPGWGGEVDVEALGAPLFRISRGDIQR